LIVQEWMIRSKNILLEIVDMLSDIWAEIFNSFSKRWILRSYAEDD
jgi:hypothetical protein